MPLPEKGAPAEEVLARLEERAARDADWAGGRLFGYVYHAEPGIPALHAEVYARAGMTNALSPAAFPSLHRCEAELVELTAELLHGPEAVGTVTTGGTESILLALKAARGWARSVRGIPRPHIVVPESAHPAFHKGADLLDLDVTLAPLGPDYRVEVDAVRAALTDRTVLLVGSAPCFPTGVVDPIPELAALAAERGILCHVDACLGGFLLPFLEALGRPVPPFDFRVRGVTSLSADLHKYGYAAKGAAVLLYRDPALRRYQFFAWPHWPGGLYACPGLTGARGGAPLVAAWATVQHLGREGYLRLAAEAMEATRQLLEGIRALPALEVLGTPAMTVFGFRGRGLDTYALGEALEARGWRLDRLQRPTGLHLTVSPVHRAVVAPLLGDLAACAEAVAREGRTARMPTARYGAVAPPEDPGALHDFTLDLLDQLYGRGATP